MARRDYYAVLGVRKTASSDEIRKAFRSLALKYHPDRNPGDAEAERRFREVAEAWEVLGDAEQRARFDRLGPLYTPSGRPPGPDEINDILRDTLGGLFGRRRDQPGEDLRYTVSVTLEDVALGCERVIDVTRIVRCRTCDATGDATEGRTPCAACGGTGKSAQRRLFRSSCATCDGRGYAPTARCSRCSGEGRHPLEEKLKLRVPAGVATGQKLKLKGKGNEGGGRTPGAPGDLLVVIDVAEHPLFRRRGADLLVEVPITFVEAALGADVPVPLLVASTTIRVPPGTASGASFRLAGRGLPSPDGGARGDLHARVFVEIPERITSEQRSALVDLSRRLGGDAHPKRRAFDEAVRSRA